MNTKEITKWFKKAVPEPTIENVCVQIGCHYEEVAEMANTLIDRGVEKEVTSVSHDYKSKTGFYLDMVGDLNEYQKEEFLDSLCDQIVTAIGVAHMLGFDIENALDEVNRSNWSKFENGEPVFDENGKIKKGQSYFKPDLSKFV